MVAHADGRTYPHDADNKARIYEDGTGHMWVSHEDLLKCGYILLDDFDIVYLNGKFYELQAHIRPAGGWWIEEVETPQEADEGEPAPEVPAGEQT